MVRYGASRVSIPSCLIVLALAGPVATAGAAPHKVSRGQHYSVAAGSATVAAKSVVLHDVASVGLLQSRSRATNSKLAVGAMVRSWNAFSARPYVRVTYVREGSHRSLRLYPAGRPVFDAKRHTLSFRLARRAKPQTLRTTRWVFGHARLAPSALSSQSKKVGPFVFVTTFSQNGLAADVVIDTGSSFLHGPALNTAKRKGTIVSGVLGVYSIEATLQFRPATRASVPGLEANVSWTDVRAGTGRFLGSIADL